MKKLFKKTILIILFILLSFHLYSDPKQSSQIIKSGHWIYDDLLILEAETKNTMFLETQPLSVGEINFFLKQIDYDKLSSSAKLVYDNINDYINKEDDFIKNDSLRVFLNLRANPELFYKSNENIPWSFSRNFKDMPFTFPIIVGFSDYFTIQTDLGLSKSFEAAAEPKSISNISFNLGDYDVYLPSFSYFSGVKIFDDWGISAHMGKEGMKIGHTSLGSIIYNDTFISDFYCQLNLFAKRLKFSMDVTQYSKDKYMFLHHATLKPFKNFNISVVEGSLITAPFELRYLNPLMIMHSFMGWYDYDHELNDYEYGYGESNFCAYLCFTFEYLPISNLRIYGLYAQNEILDFDIVFSGNPEPISLSMPDSIGAQLGVEYFIPLENNSHIKTSVEALYTSPYLYVKHSPRWSLIRTDRAGEDRLASWLGAPTGPDSFIFQTKAEYDTNRQWSAGLEYKLSLHGENTVENLFNKDKYFDGNIWHYYPRKKFTDAKERGDQKGMDEAVQDARNMWMHGTIEYKHEIAVNGHYKFLPNLDLTGQFIYTFIFNNKNTLDNFDQGVELAIALTYELF